MRALDEKEATFASRERRKKKEKEREQVAGCCCCCCCLLRPAMFNFKTGDFFFSLLVRLVETAHQLPLRSEKGKKRRETQKKKRSRW